MTTTQHFTNQHEEDVEIEFDFSMNSQSCFLSFEAHIGDKVINGLVKEKHIAKQEY